MKAREDYTDDEYYDLNSHIFDLTKQTKELKALIQELFSYYPNTRGYDDVRKELLKTINKD